MKKLCFALMSTLLLAACGGGKKDNAAISGTYIRMADSDINIVYDTVSFSLVNAQARNVYHIKESSRSVFKKEKEQSYNKRSMRTITGTYDSENQVMRTEDPGIIYSFDFEDGTVSVNAVVYRKIK